MRDYILVSRDLGRRSIDIHEIQTVRPNDSKYASFLVGSRVISDPSLHVSTRVDPLFFVLSHFHRLDGETSSRWMPWDQALEDVHPIILRALDVDAGGKPDGGGQLRHLLEVSDMCGDDMLLCRFVEARALRWLVSKFDRAAGAMRNRVRERRRAEEEMSMSRKGGGHGAFSSSFTIEEEEENTRDVVVGCGGGEGGVESIDGGDVADDPILGEEDELLVKVGALQLVCEYIPTEWRSRLSREVGMADADWMGKKGTITKPSSASAGDDDERDTADKKRPRSTWEGSIGQEDADALLRYAQGGNCARSSGASVITPGGVRGGSHNAQSVGLKKLAKVNTKGMKSLSSFFGASAKKKAK